MAIQARVQRVPWVEHTRPQAQDWQVAGLNAALPGQPGPSGQGCSGWWQWWQNMVVSSLVVGG